MTKQEIARGIKEIAKTESNSPYKQKAQDHRGRFTRARAAKDSIRNIQGE